MVKKFKSENIFDKIPFYHTYFSHNDITTDIHQHDFYELFLVTRGSIIHLVNRQFRELSENTLVLIRPGDIHNFKKIQNQKCYFINLAFTVEIFNKLNNYLEIKPINQLLHSELPPSVNIFKEKKYNILEHIDKINTISDTKKEIQKIQYQSLLLEIFSEFFHPENTEKNNIPDWLNEIYKKMQIKENFIKGRKVIIDLSSRSEAHTCRMFKKYFKMTPSQFINNKRLNYAANLLIHTRMEIQDIYFKAGFNNKNYFYELFKEKYKIPPGEYRKKYQKYII